MAPVAGDWIFSANGPCVPATHGGGRAAGKTGRRPHEHGQDHQGDAAARRGSTIRPQQVDSPVDNAFFFGITSTSASAARARAVLAVGRIIFIGILTDTRRAALSGTMGFLRKGCRKRVFGPFCGLLKCPFWPMMSSLCFSLASAPPLYQPEGKGHRSRAPPAASGPSVCPSRTFGPRIRYAALEPGPLRPLERDLLLLLRASTPISRHLPHPPPSPKPWPLSDLHFFSSDSPFGRLCLVCALSVCSLCRPHEAAQATAAAARTADRAAGGAETTAAACA